MIELRWDIRHEPAPQYGPDIVTEVKVLQYRCSPPGTIGGLCDREWMDVPTVPEGNENG